MARILIVDDQDMMRDSLAEILVREGHEVVAATDGASASAQARRVSLRSPHHRS